MEFFSRKKVCQMLDLPLGRLRYWERLGLIQSEELGFSWDALVRLRQIHRLVLEGARAVDLARGHLQVGRQRLEAHGHRLVRFEDGVGEELETGQLVLDFQSPSQPLSLPVQRDWLQMAREARERKDHQQAIEAARRALEQNPANLDAYNIMGLSHIDRGQPERAVRLYEEVLEVAPASLALRFNYGNALDDSGRLQDAIDQFEKVLEQDPGFEDAWFNVALCYERMELPNAAYRCWKRYLALDPVGPYAEQARKVIEKRHLRGDVIPLRPQ